MNGIKLRDQPYQVRNIGRGGLKVKLPAKWANVHGWEKGDQIIVGYADGKMVLTKKRTLRANQIGKYRIAPDTTILIPSALREKLGIGADTQLDVYADGDILFYEKAGKDGE